MCGMGGMGQDVSPTFFQKVGAFQTIVSFVVQLQALSAWGIQGVEDGRRPPTLWADHPQNSRKAVSGVAHPQGIEGSGMAGLGKTLGSPCIVYTPCHMGLFS
jgi:hypothetical protein